MHEILFRGKRTDNGEWVEGSLILRESYCCIIQPSELMHPMDDPFLDPEIGTIDGCATPVIPFTVGQYTGLRDKNGKRIFEGDVITGLFLYAIPVNGVCVFKDGAFGLEWDRGGTKEFSAFTSICNVEYEVIGNIHDNHELLGGDGE